MNDDGTIASLIIDALFKTVQPQRVTVLANIAFLRAEQADAGLVAALDIGEGLGVVVARAFAVRDQILKQK